jgi:hypothetical protein
VTVASHFASKKARGKVTRRGRRLYRVTMRDTDTHVEQWSEVVLASGTVAARQVIEAKYGASVSVVGVAILSAARQKSYTGRVEGR